MMSHPSLFPQIRVDLFAPFCADGVLYRAFGCVLAAAQGSVLLVPKYLVQGDLSGLVDGCPVPWEEVDDVLHLDRHAVHLFDFEADRYSERIQALASLDPEHWTLDFMPVNRHPKAQAWRFVHPSGMRYACSADLVYQINLKVTGAPPADDGETNGN